METHVAKAEKEKVPASEELANEARFSDPRLAADEHEAAVSSARRPAPQQEML